MSWGRAYRQGLTVGAADFRDFWSWKSWSFGWMLRILTNAFAWVLLGKVLGSPEKQTYLLVGNSVAVGAASALWASNACTWSRYDGTHPLLVISPAGMTAAVIGRTSIWLFNGVATSFTTFLVLALAFGFSPPPLPALAAFPLVVLVCASTFCFALFMGCLIGRWTRLRNLALDVSGTLLLAFCGATVPTSFWPAPVSAAAQLLPMTHGLSAIRAVLSGAGVGDMWWSAALELLVGAGWLAAALGTMQQLAERGREDGSIELI
ncbi:MAG: ABC transporter permease [Myxococcales bacterium]|nr:MAG: ABC transporter permease [Myxococcales bacterium]